MNKSSLKGLKFSVATLMVAFFLFIIFRHFTKFPAFPTTAPILSDTAASLDQTGSLGSTFGGGSTFTYFTTLSNIIALILIFIEWASLGKYRIPKKVKVAGLLYMSVTAVVFGTSIAPFLPGGHDGFGDIDNVYEHFIVLVAIITFTHLDKTEVKVRAKDYIMMLVFPILYLVMSSAIYFATPGNIAIYPFVDFYHGFSLGLPQGASILVTIAFLILLLSIFILAYYLFIKLSNKVSTKIKHQ